MTPLLIDTYFPNYAWLRKFHPEVYGFNKVSFDLSPDDASRMIIDFIAEKLENSLTVVIALTEDETQVRFMEVYEGKVKLGSITHTIEKFTYTGDPKPSSYRFRVEEVRKQIIIRLRTDPRTKDHLNLRFLKYPVNSLEYESGDSHDK